MADKCEWKNGKVINSEGDHKLKFYPCDGMRKLAYPSFENNQKYCKYCGAYIRKPEPKKAYLFINNEKFPIDFNDTAEKVEKNIAEIITRETGILAKVELLEAHSES